MLNCTPFPLTLGVKNAYVPTTHALSLRRAQRANFLKTPSPGIEENFFLDFLEKIAFFGKIGA